MASRLANIRIGCAGWSLSSSNAASFPADGSHLERYAQVFSGVEINSSFYRSHRPATYARWRDSVPDDFRFSVKMPRTISHECRLRETEALLTQFLAEAGQLEEKLGCLLLQLPPSLQFDAAIAEHFLKNFRQQTNAATVCEPRHATWFTTEATDLLRRYQIGGVHADPKPIPNVTLAGWDRIIYIRLHGSPVIYRSSYDDAFLSATAEHMQQAVVSADTVWCIFDNTAEGAAVPNALSLLQMLR